MSGPIRVVIADDHHLLLDGLRRALGGLPDIEVVGTVSDGGRVAEVVERLRPDVLLLDIEMPGKSGLAALRELSEPPPTVVVTMHADEEHRRRAREAGASCFLSKAAPLDDLAAAVRAARAGVRVIDADDPVAALDAHREARLGGDADTLTAREREVLRLLARGISGTAEIAEELYISQKTVKNHLASIFEKLHVSDRAQAAVEAIRLGLDR
ncbi:MAG TPA: response regulator transcription factor [Actinobacteria bacterium]|nr:response regulator transcription factor [Actinomycetota bacterium]